ncbi:hypothetical protein RSAG8_13215, partial [Rhizoctonia solani AG-8 WAC10335]
MTKTKTERPIVHPEMTGAEE